VEMYISDESGLDSRCYGEQRLTTRGGGTSPLVRRANVVRSETECILASLKHTETTLVFDPNYVSPSTSIRPAVRRLSNLGGEPAYDAMELDILMSY
jgi:hypothetical protein